MSQANKSWLPSESIHVDYLLSQGRLTDPRGSLLAFEDVANSEALDATRRAYALVKAFEAVSLLKDETLIETVAALVLQFGALASDVSPGIVRLASATFERAFESLELISTTSTSVVALAKIGSLAKSWAVLEPWTAFELPAEVLEEIPTLDAKDLGEFEYLLQEVLQTVRRCSSMDRLTRTLLDYFVSSLLSREVTNSEMFRSVAALFEDEIFTPEQQREVLLRVANLPQPALPFPAEEFPQQHFFIVEKRSRQLITLNKPDRVFQENLLAYLNAFKNTISRNLTSDTKLVPYGSCPLGTFVPTSDVNVALLHPSIQNSSRYLQLCVSLTEATDFRSEVIESYGEPVLKAWKLAQEVSIHVTVNPQFALVTQELIQLYFNSNPHAEQLVVTVKIWASRCHIHKVCLSGFHITLLVLVFLQSMEQLPLLQAAQHLPNLVEGVDVWIDRSAPAVRSCMAFGELVVRFFYWAGFSLPGLACDLRTGQVRPTAEAGLFPVHHPFTGEVVKGAVLANSREGQRVVEHLKQTYIRMRSGQDFVDDLELT